ncbi:protein ALP1-like [Drosophila obscura]|uniref:protein ALP1-like n=1 Tax=Drosophila obscura TaxID=7282 RepID=UPI001BB0EC46|nr:protein ALP1-like [Drosophila obscura]
MPRKMEIERRKKLCAFLLMQNNYIIAHLLEKQRQRKRKLASSKHLLQRELEGIEIQLDREIVDEDSVLYGRVLRISPNQFNLILEKVRPIIQEKKTPFRNSITPEERLKVTLFYLSTGRMPFRQTKPTYIPTITKILRQTIPALYNVLNGEYLPFPTSEEEWKQIAADFNDIWGFPNCIGAIDGKYCKTRPMSSEGDPSMMLMVIVDAKYRFVYVNVGTDTKIGDAEVWMHSDLKYSLDDNSIHVPSPSVLPRSNLVSSYTLVSDEAFPLTEYNMKPYFGKNLTESQQHFNYMLARSRRVVENAFGMLASRFRVIFSPIKRVPMTFSKIVLTCFCLYNFLREESIRTNNHLDVIPNVELQRIVEENFIEHVLDHRTVRSTGYGPQTREGLREYFSKLHLDLEN